MTITMTMTKNKATILAIETSCDDTCVAIVEADRRRLQRRSTRMNFNILSNIVSSQTEVHRKWGGVYPTLAKREHQKNLLPVLEKALKKAKNPRIDLIAITNGPGLEPCLWVGVNFAKALAYYWDLPIIAVNHIEAHILANFIKEQKIPMAKPSRILDKIGTKNKEQLFPAICLVVSGGHTQLILMKNFGEYKILGETRDDAAGECFDKVAKILGLDYPGGPAVAAKAKKGRGRTSTTLPRPMIHQKNYDFSFSGLKTAVLYNFKSQPLKVKKSKQYIKEMCYQVQQAIIDVLISKTIKAVRAYKVKTIILGGGVVANEELRKQFKSKLNNSGVKINLLLPPKKICTDNAAMVAVAGYFRWKKMGRSENWQDIKADANLRIC